MEIEDERIGDAVVVTATGRLDGAASSAFTTALLVW